MERVYLQREIRYRVREAVGRLRGQPIIHGSGSKLIATMGFVVRLCRCVNTGCRHKLPRVALVQWIATLVDEGLFSLDELDAIAGA
jgi:prenyltransferase beta subunit